MDTVATVRHWMVGLLAIAFLFDAAVLGLAWQEPLLLLPVPLIAAVLLALRLPVLGGLAGAVAVLGTSALLRLAHLSPPGSLATFTATEAMAGSLLIAILIWKTSRWVAVTGTVGLLLAAAGAMVLRAGYWYPELEAALRVGPAGVVVAVGGGLALRLGAGEDTDLRTFLRGQWPLATALALALLVDTTATLDAGRLGPLVAVPILAAVTTAVCAVLAPRDAARWTLTAAAIVLVATTITIGVAVLVAGSLPGLRPPVTVIAAHMALVAYVMRYSERRTAALSVVALVGADLLAIGAATLANRRLPSVLSEFLLMAAFLLLLSLATGQYFGSRDRARGQSVRVAVTGAQQAERMALARELHDVVAHHVTGIVVQAQAARLVADPDATERALAKIEHSGTEALAAMRMLVGSMRGAAAGEAGAAAAATADLAADLRAVAAGFTGPDVHMALSLPDSLPPEAGRTVLRVVQESLTNVAKHAGEATAVHVIVEPDNGDLHVRVSDDAATARVRPAGGSGGYGLVGMRERIELLGGTFTAGPGERAGWTVDARFPLRKDGP